MLCLLGVVILNSAVICLARSMFAFTSSCSNMRPESSEGLYKLLVDLVATSPAAAQHLSDFK